MRVNEIFYSLQGEGNRTGTANVFIRLSGCSMKNVCSIDCDTEFESGTEMSLDKIKKEVEKYGCSNIIWTGGEPTDQLTDEVVEYFKDYFQAIETSGVRPVPEVDWVTVSPKVAEHVLARHFTRVDELKYVMRRGKAIPEPSVEADYYYLSPHSTGDKIDMGALMHCFDLVRTNPKWRLTLQNHKLWSIQ